MCEGIVGLWLGRIKKASLKRRQPLGIRGWEGSGVDTSSEHSKEKGLLWPGGPTGRNVAHPGHGKEASGDSDYLLITPAGSQKFYNLHLKEKTDN